MVGRCSCFSCGTGRTLRLSRRRHGMIVRYVGGMTRRLERPVSGRDHSLVVSAVGLLLSHYVHFCSHRFVAERGTGGSLLTHFRLLLGGCCRSTLPADGNVPAMRCYTSRLYLSAGCFDSLMGGRANVSTVGRVRRGVVSVTGRHVVGARGDVDRVSSRVNFRCPRRFAH